MKSKLLRLVIVAVLTLSLVPLFGGAASAAVTGVTDITLTPASGVIVPSGTITIDVDITTENPGDQWTGEITVKDPSDATHLVVITGSGPATVTKIFPTEFTTGDTASVGAYEVDVQVDDGTAYIAPGDMAADEKISFVVIDTSNIKANPHLGGTGFGSTPDGCAGCHRAHTAKGKKLLTVTKAEFCYSCHENGVGAYTDVANGLYYGTADGGQNDGLRGGGFLHAKMDTDMEGAAEIQSMTSAHTVSGASGTMWGSGPISGTEPGDPGSALELYCVNCHDPHGNSMYRILRPSPRGMPSGSPVEVADESTTTYTAEYWSTDYKKTDYAPDNLGDWCAQCHTRYLAGAEAGHTDSGDAIFEYRHMTQGTLLGCIKCHDAHGTSATMGDYSGTVPWPGGGDTPEGNERSSLLWANNRGVCAQCHVTAAGGEVVFGDIHDSYHGQMGKGSAHPGMLEKWCALPNFNYAVEGMGTWNTRCGKCHVGASWNPDKPYGNCALCHEGGIGTGAVTMGTFNDFSVPGCLSCHMKETPKRGMVWDDSHDVHLTTGTFGTGHETTCQDCHERQADANSDHQFAKGTSIDTSEPTHQGTLNCSTCHTSATLHADALLDPVYDNASHAGGKVACETCHIGQRDANTALATRSWVTLTATGSFTGTKRAAFMPFYKWYDNTGAGAEGNYHLPILDYTTRQAAPGAMIYPFNEVAATWFALDVDGDLAIGIDELDVNVLIGHVKDADVGDTGEGAYTTTTAEMVAWWNDSANGTEVDRYAAEYGTITGLPIQVTENMNFNISHGVLSGAAAECGDCHGAGTRLNWTQLGYPSDPNP